MAKYGNAPSTKEKGVRATLITLILASFTLFSVAVWASKSMTTPEQLTVQGLILLGCGLLTMGSLFIEP